jgi:hypothetical protein
LDKVEGWNSLSIHFWIVASSARTGDASVKVATSAAALAIASRRDWVAGLPRFLRFSIFVSSVAALDTT